MSSSPQQKRDELVAIARTVRTRGLCGELVAEILTDFPERFNHTKEVFCINSNGNICNLELERFWFHKDRIVLKFFGVDSIDEAKSLVNCEICVHESETVKLSEDEFYDWQLIGCKVETLEKENLGCVTDILRNGATEILVVQGKKKDYLIPFVKSICQIVDIDEKLIRVDLPEGLLEF
ncbi:MAG: ribosome maturation factor RimM [Pyrinomonadaceae bacterium]|nr:ribosome maturation factor RimM [Pyrinomonadaceae bacterium]MCX7640349.1 ribosome maturation factor RimM [Pyrinomonadaceae bacterium]MDW8304777.1 ribosome maturation factor RimM [Acidobacteriota bacterium]